MKLVLGDDVSKGLTSFKEGKIRCLSEVVLEKEAGSVAGGTSVHFVKWLG